MFGGGWTEMLIIGVVALVVIGPKDLPVVMRKLGRVVGTIRRMGGEFQAELNKTTGLDQITDLRRQITEPLRQTRDEIVSEFNKITTTGVEPTGIVKPADPNVESVYETIAANSAPAPNEAVAAAAPPVMKPMAPIAAEPSPAPAEASVPAVVEAPPAKPKRTPRAKPAKSFENQPQAPSKPKSASRAKAGDATTPKPRARSAAAKAPVASVAAKEQGKAEPKPARARAKKA
jgi:sec-independent protein translocase protein TatB